MKPLIKLEFIKLIQQPVVWLITICSFLLLIVTKIFYYVSTTTSTTANAWEAIATFPYMEGTLVQAAILLAALPAVFSGEYESKMDALLLSSSHGKKQVIFAKILATILFTTSVVLLSWLLGSIIHWLFTTHADPYASIASLTNHEQTPYHFSLWQYSFVQLVTNWIGAIAFSMFILYVSVHTRHYIISYFIGGLLLTLTFFIRNFSVFSVEWVLKYMTLIDVMRVQNMFSRERFVMIGNYTLSLPISIFYSYVIVAICMFSFGCYYHFKHRQVTS
ncbi:hypothetical protein ACFSTH_08780 [Paenibacillus yanchengensis]|uniref:ABC transporter permease n=1 Tax=Paenibacillus yanchengensis TaxID=2035833 RepID=A0ABW4YKJ9_9BACL